jgi:hypothetical protein
MSFYPEMILAEGLLAILAFEWQKVHEMTSSLCTLLANRQKLSIAFWHCGCSRCGC